MTYRQLLNELARFSQKDLEQEVMVEEPCNSEFGPCSFLGDFNSIETIKEDELRTNIPKVGQIYLR